MQIDKHKILRVKDKSFLVMDYLFYRGDHYLLTVELLNDQEDLGTEMIIFVEQKENDKTYIQRVKDEAILNYICPIFEHNLKNNLT